jgi:uncharacterized protein (TIGR04255 family)
MPTAKAASFPVLEKPPIVEVVCGVQFDPVDLDPLVLGVYWDSRREEFPQRSLQPAIVDGSGLILGNLPLRSVFVAADEVHVLQIQHDRFFMNWRAVGKGYPRFSNRGGKGGLMHHAIEEFGKLSAFCERRFGGPLSPIRAELSKIDVIEKGRHWRDLENLRSIIPITGTFGGVQQGGNRQLALRFVETEGPRNLTVSVNSASADLGGDLTSIRIETRAVVPVLESGLEAAFVEANGSVNHAFFTLIGEDGLTVFGVEVGGG